MLIYKIVLVGIAPSLIGGDSIARLAPTESGL